MDNQGYPEQRYVVTALLRYIVAAIAIACIVALFTWFFFFRGSKSGSPKPTKSDTSQTIKDTSTGSKSESNSTDTLPGEDGATNTNDDNSSSTDQSDGEEKLNKPATATHTDELANTGPGNVIAIFAVAAIIGGVFRRYQLSRSKS